MTTLAPDSRRWLALVLLCATQFILVLDVAIVNVALPSIQRELEFSQQNLQWVVNAYTLVFGGFLLLGGRAGDLLGRRRVFIAGIGLFALASLAGGLAETGGFLIAARATQGLGAALCSPAALSILTTIFTEGSERNCALGVWGTTGASGAATGALLGGILTGFLGWEWVLFVNVPIGAAAALLAPVIPRESRDTACPQQFDIAGAVCVTAGLVLLVFAIVGTETAGWASARTLGLLFLSLVLLGGFVVIERRSPGPLVPFRIFRLRNLTGANLVTLVHATGPLSTLFFISLYLQQVLGLSAVVSGLAFLPFSLLAGVSSSVASQLVDRFGLKQLLVGGMILMAGGLLLFAQISVGGNYWRDVLPASLVIAVGAGLSFVPLTTALTAGFQSAFVVGAGLVALGALLALVIIRRSRSVSQETRA